MQEQEEKLALRAELKAWEAAFLAAEGRKPSNSDISTNKEIATKYKRYDALKKREAGGPSSPSSSKNREAKKDHALTDSKKKTLAQTTFSCRSSSSSSRKKNEAPSSSLSSTPTIVSEAKRRRLSLLSEGSTRSVSTFNTLSGKKPRASLPSISSNDRDDVIVQSSDEEGDLYAPRTSNDQKNSVSDLQKEGLQHVIIPLLSSNMQFTVRDSNKESSRADPTSLLPRNSHSSWSNGPSLEEGASDVVGIPSSLHDEDMAEVESLDTGSFRFVVPSQYRNHRTSSKAHALHRHVASSSFLSSRSLSSTDNEENKSQRPSVEESHLPASATHVDWELEEEHMSDNELQQLEALERHFQENQTSAKNPSRLNGVSFSEQVTCGGFVSVDDLLGDGYEMEPHDAREYDPYTDEEVSFSDEEDEVPQRGGFEDRGSGAIASKIINPFAFFDDETAPLPRNKKLNLVRQDLRKNGSRLGAKSKHTLSFKKKNHRSALSRNKTCFYCGEEGHWKDNCPFWNSLDGDTEKSENNDFEITGDSSLSETSFDVFQSIDSTHVALVEGLRELTGFEAFREGQEEAVSRTMCGLDVLLVLSTGAGKSLCYQLPSYLMKKAGIKCLGIVVSPLLSLMDDQVSRIPSPLKAATYNAASSPHQKEIVKQRILRGDVDLLFVSPETLTSQSTLSLLSRARREGTLIPFVCIDEAHCISEWSHSFRPAYMKLRRVVREVLAARCVLALTATAMPSTQDSILRHLGMPASSVLTGPLMSAQISLSVVGGSHRDHALLHLLKEDDICGSGPVLVYCARQADTETVARTLRAAGIKASCYHGGMTYTNRASVQAQFLNNRVRVVVATIAFGLGINKPDIRAVIHYHIPKSPENYVQEIGRAGRDGHKCRSVVFVSESDLALHRKHAYSDSLDDGTIKRFVTAVLKGSEGEQATIARVRELVAMLGPLGTEALKRVSTPASSSSSSSSSSSHSPCRYAVLDLAQLEGVLDIKQDALTSMATYMEVSFPSLFSPEQPVQPLLHVRMNKGYEGLINSDPVMCALFHASKSNHNPMGGMDVSLQVLCNVFCFSPHEMLQRVLDLHRAHWLSVDCRGVSYCLRVCSPHLISPQQESEVFVNLVAQNRLSEDVALRKLDAVYQMCKDGLSLFRSSTAPNKQELVSQSMHAALSKYFSSKEELDGPGVPSTSPELTAQEILQLRERVKLFLSRFYSKGMTGRVVARIFHGIHSPSYPLSEWGRSEYWGKAVNTDFNALRRVAQDAIVSYVQDHRSSLLD